MPFIGPTETNWKRHTGVDLERGFRFSQGKFGPWRFEHPKGRYGWSEKEMLQVDALMYRACRVDRATWLFRKFGNPDAKWKFDAMAPRWHEFGLRSRSIGELLAKTEIQLMGSVFWRVGVTGVQSTCAWCSDPVSYKARELGMFKDRLIPHAERMHPDEIAKVRVEWLARVEEVRAEYRRNDELWTPESGPHPERHFIL